MKNFLCSVTTADGQVKIVKNVVVPNQVSGRTTLTSLLTNNVPSSKFAGRKVIMTKGTDGSSRMIAANILPKGVQTTQQSLIKIQPTTGQSAQQIQIQQSGKFET